MDERDITNFPLLGYRIIAGVGLGYRLEYDNLGQWDYVMDSIHYIDCIEAMHKDIKYAREDRWGED